MELQVIGIDTNILIRWITLDDPIQCRKVAEVFQRHHLTEEIFVADTVLIELEWVLSSIYNFQREQISDALRMIIRTRQFLFRNKETIIRAIDQYNNGERDFSDCMIGELGHEFNVKTYTFDKGLKNNSNFIILK